MGRSVDREFSDISEPGCAVNATQQQLFIIGTSGVHGCAEWLALVVTRAQSCRDVPQE
jgi:hypothetical protein